MVTALDLLFLGIIFSCMAGFYFFYLLRDDSRAEYELIPLDIRIISGAAHVFFDHHKKLPESFSEMETTQDPKKICYDHDLHYVRKQEYSYRILSPISFEICHKGHECPHVHERLCGTYTLHQKEPSVD